MYIQQQKWRESVAYCICPVKKINVYGGGERPAARLRFAMTREKDWFRLVRLKSSLSLVWKLQLLYQILGVWLLKQIFY